MSKSMSPDASYLDSSKKSGHMKGGTTDAPRTAPGTEVGKYGTLTDAGTTRGTLPATDAELRQSNLTNTSFALPTQQHPSLSLVQTRSKKRNGARTLYVPLREDAEEDASTGSRGRANDSTAPDPKDNGQLVVVGDAEDMKLSALVENVSNTLSNVPIQKLTRRPAVIAASIFLYLLLINIFALTYAGQHSAALLEQESTRNGDLFSLSSSLCYQLEYFKDITERLQHDVNHSPEVNVSMQADLKYAADKVSSLKMLFNHSVIALHHALGYKGKLEDLAFLVETHVLYDRRIKVAADEELLWLQSARLSQHGRQKYLGPHAHGIHFFERRRAEEEGVDNSDDKEGGAAAKKGIHDSGDLYFNKGEQEENTFLRDVSVNRHKANALSFRELVRKFLENKFAVVVVLVGLLLLFFRT